MRPALLLLAAAATAALAHTAHSDSLEDAIKARQAYFTLMGANIGPLAAMAKGEAEFDAELERVHIDNLVRLATYNPFPHFPAGTSNAEQAGKTRALPAIWEDFGAFVSRHEDFNTAVAGLEQVAGQGRAALGPAVGRLGETCKACHDDYRAKDF